MVMAMKWCYVMVAFGTRPCASISISLTSVESVTGFPAGALDMMNFMSAFSHEEELFVYYECRNNTAYSKL